MPPARPRRLVAVVALLFTGAALAVAGTAHGDEETCDPLFSARKFNSAPLAVDDDAWVEPGARVPIDVLANDSDFDGDELVIDSASVPSAGSVSIEAGVIVYVADQDEGPANFTYRVTDLTCGVDVATVRVVVASEDEPEDMAEPTAPVTSVPDFAG